MANPRKFSEKIALHNKKQAEGTAAFEAVLREVSASTQGVLGQQKCQQLSPSSQTNETVPHGGSLPNVKFASNSSIDLQNALHCLEGMKQSSNELSRQSLIDKLHSRERERCRQPDQNQTRQVIDHKRRDCSPYSLSYLSPPPDTSWRRVNSDSSIHSSALAAPCQQTCSSPIRSSSPVNGFSLLATGSSYTTPFSNNSSVMLPLNQMIHSQSCSCDIQHNLSNTNNPLEQDSGIHMPPAGNNTGSLPNLSDTQYTLVFGTHEDATESCIGPMRAGTTQGSPGCRHRHVRCGPKPLYLPTVAAVTSNYQTRGIAVPPLSSASLMQYRGSSLSDCGTPSPSPVSPSPLSLHSYSPPSPGFFSDVLFSQQQQQQQHYQLQQQFEQFSMLPGQENVTLDSAACQPSNMFNFYQSTSPSLYKSATASVLSALNGDNFALQQQQQQHSVANCREPSPLNVTVSRSQHDVVLQNSSGSYLCSNGSNNQLIALTSSPYTGFNSQYAGCQSVNSCYQQPFQSLGSSSSTTDVLDRIQLNITRLPSQLPNASSANIPDIVLTEADELMLSCLQCVDQGLDAASSSALTASTAAGDNDDLVCLDDALGVGLNPLELDELQMLTDCNMLTDPATEDSFRFDDIRDY